VKTGGSLRVFEELEQEVFLIGFLKVSIKWNCRFFDSNNQNHSFF
jgi:hypothetical protein